MSEYHYKYDPPRRGPHNRNGGDSGGGLIGLLVDIVLSVAVAIPMGIAFLVKQIVGLFGGAEGTAQSQAGFGQTQQGQTGQYSNLHQVQRPGPGQAAPSPKNDKKKDGDDKKVKASAGRGLMILGGILTGIFGGAFLLSLAEVKGLSALISTGIFAGAGLLTLLLGFRRRRKARLYLKYLGLIGRRESVSLTTLAKAAGRSRKKVCNELQDMLDKGILPTGYLDLAGDKLVLSEKGIDDAPAAEDEAPAKTEDDENAILREIREVNDSIPDPVMSAKIDRIGEITAKILDHQRTHPGKASQSRVFLNYYLPTTLKILRAYAQLDQQGVDGENISAAKARIEGMMDKVVEGFEKQLDRLFQDDALDITSDVAVLEQMLENDGLGSGEGLTLGGTGGT